MNRKTILTSAILALFAVGQSYADNSFVVKDSNTGKKQLEEKGALHSACDDCARALAEGFYDDTVGLVTETEKHEFWEVRE